MKILNNFCNSFTGHSAGKIKALYMQNPSLQSQINIYNELKSIGAKEGFDVFMHSGDEIKQGEISPMPCQYSSCDLWSQDNKIILSNDKKKNLLYFRHRDKVETQEALQFAEILKFDKKPCEVIFDGGDLFVGKRDDNTNYVLTSNRTLRLTAEFQYLKSKNGKKTGFDEFNTFVLNDEFYNKNNQLIASMDDYKNEAEYWESKARKIICHEFGVDEKDLIILPQNEFHLDLTLRPLDYPFVLVNDDEEVDKLLAKLTDEFFPYFRESLSLIDLRAQVKKQRGQYSPSSETIEILKQNGFVPIKIAGMLGRGNINFMNAIVQQSEDGLVYITNKIEPLNAVYQYIFDNFKKDISEKCPQIKRLYFVGGEKCSFGNDIMNYLEKLLGGIHCLCCEEME